MRQPRKLRELNDNAIDQTTSANVGDNKTRAIIITAMAWSLSGCDYPR
jgi:hypothetical protein